MTVVPTAYEPKRVGEVERREIRWIGALGSDTLSTSVWSVEPAGLTLASPQIVGTVTSILVSAGVSKTTYEISNTVTTGQGHTLIEVVLLYVI